MPNYTHVQFISWEIYTGPNRDKLPLPYPSVGTSYTGLGNTQDSRLDIAGQILDIFYRYLFTKQAIDAAHSSVDKTPTTLKVFMGPEFLYRGKGGAYIHDLINGWEAAPPADFDVGTTNFPGLFGYLQRFVSHSDYQDWLFVFGTAISASFPARKNENGKWVIDPTQKGEVYNTALIRAGGEGGDAYASRKKYKSSIDFIEKSYGFKAFTDGDTIPLDRADLEPDETGREGSATFIIKGVNDKDGQPINLGLEVCLDHAWSRSDNKDHAWGRIRSADKYVKLQLVPSGGMDLQTNSIRLLPAAGPTPNSYAFNCDGLCNNTVPTQYGAKTQIWNGANGGPVPPENKLISTSYGEKAKNTTLTKVPEAVQLPDEKAVNATQLWGLGSGYVRAMQPMLL